jgi:hypothetical protein
LEKKVAVRKADETCLQAFAEVMEVQVQLPSADAHLPTGHPYRLPTLAIVRHCRAVLPPQESSGSVHVPKGLAVPSVDLKCMVSVRKYDFGFGVNVPDLLIPVFMCENAPRTATTCDTDSDISDAFRFRVIRGVAMIDSCSDIPGAGLAPPDFGELCDPTTNVPPLTVGTLP